MREVAAPAARSAVAQVLQERRRSDLNHVPDRAGALQGNADKRGDSMNYSEEKKEESLN
jgi:hypothetical protein